MPRPPSWWRLLAIAGAAVAAAFHTACTRTANSGSASSPEPQAEARARIRRSWPQALRDLAVRAEERFAAPSLTLSTPADLPVNARLVDVRTPEEIAVSKLPGAIELPSQEARAQFLETASRTDDSVPILVYCTAGWRSAEFTRALVDRGIPAINLEGGICAYAHCGGALFSADGAPTRRIHSYSEQFAPCVPPGFESVAEPRPKER